MKLLDRYFCDIFTSAVIIFLFALLSLFVIVDFTTHISKFAELKNIFLPFFVLKFYAYCLQFFIFILLPLAVLFAAVFTLSKFMKNNELTPIVVHGISLRRVVLPLLVSGIICALVVAFIEEFVMPEVSQKINETENILKDEEVTKNVIVNDSRGFHFFAEKYNQRKNIMSNAVITLVADRKTKKTFFAEEVIWDEKLNRWILYDGKIYNYDIEVMPEGERPRYLIEKIGEEGLVIDSDLKPNDIEQASSFGGQYMHFSEMLNAIDRCPWATGLLVKLHQRLTFPISALVLILIGLPLVIEGGVKGLFKQITLCFLLSLAYYLLTLFFSEIGERGEIHPILAAWFPTLIFGGIGIFFFTQMKT